MRATLPALSLLLIPAADLSIDYTAERTVEVSIETEYVSETTDMSMEIDGEPVDGGGRFGGGGGMEYSREVVFSETYLENDEGAPTKVRRSFDTVEATSTMMFGEESMDNDVESPMEDVVLIITLEDGEAVAEVEDDGDVERSEMLDGHKIENMLHGLLPTDGDDAWEPESDGVAAALLLDLEGALFPRPEPEEGGGERGRGRGGMRGGMRGSPMGFLRQVEWDTEASLTDRIEDIDDIECAVIELTFEAEGELPERGSGRGRDRSFGMAAPETVLESTFEAELTGYLYFSIEERRPVKLELEGEIIQDTLTERDSPRGSFRMERTQESTLEHTITLTLI